MAFITTGLANGGRTTHYQIQYDDSLSQADGVDRANGLIGVCETDFTLMTNWFGGISLPYSIPYTVQISPGPGASASWGSGPPINLVPGNGGSLDLVRYLLVAEVTEMFMLQQGFGWSPRSDNEGSAGEGLSHFLATQLLVALASPLRPSAIANLWLNSPRADFVNNVDFEDNANDPKTGCAVLFLYYLFHQLGFDTPTIVGAGNQELAGVYRNLTGDSSDPFPFFKQLLDAAFPSTTSSAVPGPNRDDPYPLGSLSFWVDKSTFGKDEVQDVLNSPTNGLFPKAFWLVLEGFNRQVWNGVAPTLAGATLGFAGIAITPNPGGPEFEISGSQTIPQRIRFPFDIRFSAASLAGFPLANSAPIEDELDASITVVGKQFSTSTVLEFVAGADPYFTNVDPAQENVFYLSQDLRVFTATPSLNNRPIPGGPAFGADNPSGGYEYIQNLIAYLNANFRNPAGTDPFDPASSLIPGQVGALTGDSSVTPFTSSGGQNHANYNFALARVRLRGSQGTAGEAQNVRVFFRAWGTQSADTDYQLGSTYLSHSDPSNLPDWPLPATDNHTIPFFATGNSPNFADPNNPEYGASGVNNRTVIINTGDSVWGYFGCFLNVYDPSNIVHGAPVQSLLVGTHHCIVAQIAFDGAPIVNSNGVTMNPENSDKLAQRNLEVTHSDNPGAAATHRIPQTFDLRPSAPLVPGQGDLLDYPDELMIEWGKTPPGSVASLYWPRVDASQVLQLASRMYGAHLLSASDNHTIQCNVSRGITYIPIPSGTGENYAGLFTIDLPSTVVKGQEFDVVVRRVATRRKPDIILLRKQLDHVMQLPADTKKASTKHVMTLTQGISLFAEQAPPIIRKVLNWRYVVGTFQVKIPVSTRDLILPAEENTLAIFKWRLQQTASTNRWYPVLQRYIEYLSGRVDGLGGNSGEIAPSPGGVPAGGKRPASDRTEFTGKVCEIFYNCFGSFEGFALETCSGKRSFRTCESEIGELVLRACKDRLLLSVFVRSGHEPMIQKLVVQCCC